MRHSAETDAVFPHGYSLKDGFLHPDDAPGHGVDIDESLAARYPYRPTSLPISRLEDGTMHNW
jgi:mannonate dehydratase